MYTCSTQVNLKTRLPRRPRSRQHGNLVLVYNYAELLIRTQAYGL